jgi:hypothetical protein
MSQPSELPVELSASYAHRVADDIRLVLQLADEVDLDASAQLQLRAGKKVVRVPSTASPTEGGPRLEARLPAADLRPGVWRVALVSADQGVRPVEARLLNSRKQPVALLPGPTPRTELAPPQPVQTPAAGPGGKARAYRAAAQIADRGLRLLPDDRAARYRGILKKAGRRVLS